jgi:hypothetical protein
MQHSPLFDEEALASGRGSFPVLGVIDGTAAPTKTQRQFNKLIERLNGQRRELARWKAFRQTYQQQLAAEYQPLAARLREKRIAMAELLDRAMDSTALGNRERDKVRDILDELLSELLAEAEDAKLVRLHDKYADVSFGEEQQDRMEAIRTLASETLGIDVEAYEGEESPEELADWLEEQVRASRPDPHQPQERKRTAKSVERQALQDQAAEGATRAVREVFRKLVSELHPDRETDPLEQARKTELMQRVNQAYKAGDLLGLLELQLSIEQIDSTALAGLAEERLRHYLHVLEEQSRRLRDELSEFIAPFAMALGNSRSGKVTPEAVQRALAVDIRALKEILRNIETDLIRFRNIQLLKQSLRTHRLDRSDDDAWGPPDEFRVAPRRRRRR